MSVVGGQGESVVPTRPQRRARMGHPGVVMVGEKLVGRVSCGEGVFAGGVGGLVSFEGMLGARTLRCWPEKA